MPPASLAEPLGPRFVPAPEVVEWINDQILSEDGPIHNPDHKHLNDADVAVLWAGGSFVRGGRTVLGMAEQVAFRVSGWARWRQEEQLQGWFGRVPAFLITLDALYSSNCSDTDWCALVEHELYHIAQAVDEFMAPKFDREGNPKLCIRGHDVEEFVGVVRRYGAGVDVQRLVNAANARPEVSAAQISGACGTCMLKLA